MKKLILFFFLLIQVSVVNSAESITHAFGVQFGSPFNASEADKSDEAYGKKAKEIEFTPSKPYALFDEYNVIISKFNSHPVRVIASASNRIRDLKTLQTEMTALIKIIKSKYNVHGESKELPSFRVGIIETISRTEFLFTDKLKTLKKFVSH